MGFTFLRGVLDGIHHCGNVSRHCLLADDWMFGLSLCGIRLRFVFSSWLLRFGLLVRLLLLFGSRLWSLF
jgi:hypothetical protein